MSKLHQHVRHDLGLALVVGAFVAAWFTAALPSLSASLMARETVVNSADLDGNGMADVYEAR